MKSIELCLPRVVSRRTWLLNDAVLFRIVTCCFKVTRTSCIDIVSKIAAYKMASAHVGCFVIACRGMSLGSLHQSEDNLSVGKNHL
jgi:hypothetical protein